MEPFYNPNADTLTKIGEIIGSAIAIRIFIGIAGLMLYAVFR